MAVLILIHHLKEPLGHIKANRHAVRVQGHGQFMVVDFPIAVRIYSNEGPPERSVCSFVELLELCLIPLESEKRERGLTGRLPSK